MNTNDDLIRRIGEVVDERVTAQLEPIKNRLDSLEKGQKSQRKSSKKLQKTLDVVIDTFDRGDIHLHKRVKRIETHLGLPNFE